MQSSVSTEQYLERGKIQNPDRAKQLRDFSGLKWGNITPTDIDGFVDFHNEIFIFKEYKLINKELPRGQELALERLVDNSKLTAIAIIGEHNTSPEEVIPCADTIVVRYYYKKRWRKPKNTIKMKDFIDRFLQWMSL